VTLLAEREGVPVLPVVAAGMATKRDALLVSEITGRRFSALGPDEIDDELLREMWEAVIQLHDLGIAHHQIGGERFVVRPTDPRRSAASGEPRRRLPTPR